jgi:hypothetical protein
MNLAAPEESRGGPINYSHADWADPVPQLGPLAALIQQRIRHIYRRQRTTPLPSRTAMSPSRLHDAGRSSRFNASRSDANSGPLNVIRVSLHWSRSDHGPQKGDCTCTTNSTPLCRWNTAPLNGLTFMIKTVAAPPIARMQFRKAHPTLGDWVCRRGEMGWG